ncbi:MAG: hypothetical protein AAFX08_05260 [Pseudomonadota bacterium]
MSDERLKRIWSGFEAKTSRRLTGGGVENIVAPSRAHEDDAPLAAPPEGLDSPAQAAFAALKREIAEKEGRAGRKNKAPALAGPTPASSFGARTPPAPHEPMAEMMKGLASTERRTERPALDYRAYRAWLLSETGKPSRKKKRFGIF